MRAQPECTASRGHDAASARFRTGKRSDLRHLPPASLSASGTCQCHWPQWARLTRRAALMGNSQMLAA